MKNRIILGTLLLFVSAMAFALCLPHIRNTFWTDSDKAAQIKSEFSEPRPESDPASQIPLEPLTERSVAVPQDRIELIPDVTQAQHYYPRIFQTKRSPEKLNAPIEIARAEKARADMKPVLRESDNPEGRANWFMEQRMYPFSKLPEDARRRAWQEVLNRGEGFGPEGAGTTWTPIGPAPTAGNGPGGAVSGRINSIAVSPTNTQLILVAGGTGGIWRSTNGGTTFVPVTDSLVDVAVGTIAFAPSNSNIVYAGLGDNDNGYWGTGVLRSNDAGASWTRVNNNTFPDRGQATRVMVDPTNPNKVYLAQFNSLDQSTGGGVVGGIFISTDGGVNWTRTLIGLASDLAIHPTNPQIVYAALRFGNSDAAPRGLFKSTNGGTTWNNVLASPYTAEQGSTKDFRVAVTPAAPDRVFVYFGSDGPPKEVRIEVSNNAGATFTDRGVISNMILDPGQFGYNTYLEASPTAPNTIYVGARDTFRSTDGGVTYTNLNNSFAPPYDPGDFTEQLQKIHTDQQAFAFEPGSSTTFYAANDGGIFKTTNSGETFTSLNQTLSLVQFIGLAVHPFDASRSYGGTQDNGSQRRVGGGIGWAEFVGGDGGRTVINPVDPTMVFPSFTNGALARVLNNGTGNNSPIADSTVFGESAGDDARIGFYPPIVSNGVDPRIYSGSWRLFICTNCDDLNRSLENQNPPTWTAPGGMFDQTRGGNDVLSAITIARSNLNIIYTGSNEGRAMISTNGGANWTDISTGLPNRSIRSIAVSPTNPALVYLTVSGYGSGHVFRSTNSGAIWTDISNNLPNIPTSAFMIDRLTPTTLYAGTDIGVFRSTDNGANWAVFNNGLPPVPVMEFTSQANGLIQIGTYGRGAYELPTGGGPTPTPTPTPGATPTPTPVPTPTPGGTTLTVAFTGPTVAIPDNLPAGVNIPIVVASGCTISDLNFRFDGTASADPLATTVGVNHSFVGDLKITLRSPSGTTAAFFDRPGMPASTGCDSNNLAAVIIDDDGGFPPVENQCGGNTDAAFPSGTFSPNSPLSAFDGQNSAGTWILNVSDNASDDTGAVRAFSLVFASCGAPTPTPTQSPTPTPTPAPGCTPNANIVVDGGFEATTNNGTNPNWTTTSTAFGTTLCNVTGCGTGSTPRTGSGWVWFDDDANGTNAENGTARQTITIQPGRTATLNYYFRASRVTSPASSVLTVSVDGTVVQTVTEPAAAETVYTLRTVDLSGFANGSPRQLSFNYSRPAGTTGSDSFLVDDVTLSITCPLSVAAVSGRVTTPAGLGLRNAIVSLIDPQGVRRTATTSSFGVFNFASIPTGVSYVVSVSSKRYRFAAQTIPINGTLSNVNFVGLE